MEVKSILEDTLLIPGTRGSVHTSTTRHEDGAATSLVLVLRKERPRCITHSPPSLFASLLDDSQIGKSLFRKLKLIATSRFEHEQSTIVCEYSAHSLQSVRQLFSATTNSVPSSFLSYFFHFALSIAILFILGFRLLLKSS